MLTIEKIKTLRIQRKNKWGFALLNFIKPLIEENYSYAQISDLLKEKYDFEINPNLIAALAFYYKDCKPNKVVTVAVDTKIGKSKNNEVLNEKIGQSEDENLEILTKKMLSEDYESTNFTDYQKEIKAKLKW